jgi:uncharacterized membrane protein YeaQ/YmgE (transglycosylase-associated protein family)
MTGELLLASVVVGLFGGWLVGLLVGKGTYGLLGDLSLGLVGGSLAVWIYQAVGMAEYAGIIGGMMAALAGAVGVVVAQRKLQYLRV